MRLRSVRSHLRHMLAAVLSRPGSALAALAAIGAWLARARGRAVRRLAASAAATDSGASPRARPSHLCLWSSLEGSTVRLAAPSARRRGAERWAGACPCCRRPLEACLSEPWTQAKPLRAAQDRCAYVINLWGASSDYALGALVLGHSIKRTGSLHARVCLHTKDVPASFVRLLSEIWEMRLVEHVEACLPQLSFQDEATPHRFDKVFTKLRAMELTDFAKVLVMDIDLIVRANIDELFEVRAPAALRRGMNDSKWPLKTGDPIPGAAFFIGRDDNPKWSWGQGTGINAGVMLLQPNQAVFDQMAVEILEPNNPSHARGNGPEQDYLSRFWSDAPWSQIGVEYNFQLHQMFFSLHPKWAGNSERAQLLLTPEKIKIVHYSGEPTAKPWHRIMDERFAAFWPSRDRDAEYATLFADEFLGHWLWVRKDPKTWEDIGGRRNGRSEMQDLYLADDGEIYKRPWEEGGTDSLVSLPSEIRQGAMHFMNLALGLWFDCFEELQRDVGYDVRSALREENLRHLVAAEAPAQTAEAAPAVRATEREPQAPSACSGWWTERGDGADAKLSVACSGADGCRFVSFCERGLETLGEGRDDPEVAGLFAKIAGEGHGARRFAAGGDGDDLAALQLWVDCVPAGAAVLLAIVGVDGEALPALLKALSPLGVPRDLPSASPCRALAAVGTRPRPGAGGWYGQPRGNHKAKGNEWRACHASSDLAYASIFAPPADG